MVLSRDIPAALGMFPVPTCKEHGLSGMGKSRPRRTLSPPHVDFLALISEAFHPALLRLLS